MGSRTSASRRSARALLASLAAGCLSAAAHAGLPIEAGWADHTYPDAAGANGQPSGEMAESKLWWNDGAWWGSLWSDAAGAYTIQRLDAGSQAWVDTGVAIDDRLETRADALFDAGRLYVASHWFHDPGEPAAPGQRARLYRYSFDPATDSHSLDPGFPVEVNAAWSETAVLARDTAGTLWVAWVESQQVMLNRSLGGNDAQWGTPFALPTPHAANLTSDDLVSIVAYDGRIGCLWSNQTDLSFYFAAHRDGDPDGTWSEANVYGISTDDHVNLKALADDPAGRLFAAVKTSHSSDLILLLVCRSTAGFCTSPGDWEAHTVWGANPAGLSPTRPILQIDTTSRELYVFTRSIEYDEFGDETRAIYYKRADLDAIAFPDPSGLGTPMVLETGGHMNDPSATKGLLDATTGLLVLASDSAADRYFHGFVTLSGGGSSTHSLTLATSGSGSATAAPAPGPYPLGTLVTLTASPEPGWRFDRWSGDLSGAASPASLVLDADKSVMAVFEPSATQPRFEEVALGEAVGASRVTTGAALTASQSAPYLAAVAIRPSGTVLGMEGLGLTWTLVRRQCSGRDNTSVELWRAQGTPAASGSVAADLSEAVSAATLVVARYAGASPKDPLGTVASANSNGSAGACTGGTDSAAYTYPLATGGSDRVVFAATALRSRSHTPGAGWTEQAELASGSGGSVAGLAAMDRAVAAAATIAVEGSLSGSVDWASLAVEIVGAGSGRLKLSCGLGFELSLLLPPLAWLRGRRRSRR